MSIEQIISEIKAVEDPVEQMQFRQEIIEAVISRQWALSISPAEKRRINRAARETIRTVPGVLKQIDKFLEGIKSSPATEESHSNQV